METKICKKCGVEKELCEFNKDRHAKDGVRSRCRVCTSLEYRGFYYQNREREVDRQVNYQTNNKEKVNLYRKKTYNEKYKNNLLYRIKILSRNRIRKILKKMNLDMSPDIIQKYNFVGCSPSELKIHIESKFKEGMTWENYGHKGWHVDHIIPLSSAKNIEEVAILSNFTNLQPLWCDENYKKGSRFL